MEVRKKRAAIALCIYLACVILTFIVAPKRMVCDVCGKSFTGANFEDDGEYICPKCMRMWAFIAPDDLIRGNGNIVRNILLVFETLGIIGYIIFTFKDRIPDEIKTAFSGKIQLPTSSAANSTTKKAMPSSAPPAVYPTAPSVPPVVPPAAPSVTPPEPVTRPVAPASAPEPDAPSTGAALASRLKGTLSTSSGSKHSSDSGTPSSAPSAKNAFQRGGDL